MNEQPMDETLENLAMRLAALSSLRWDLLPYEGKERYRRYAQDDLERRKHEAEEERGVTVYPPLKFK
jgi:hypothetical protein